MTHARPFAIAAAVAAQLLACGGSSKSPAPHVSQAVPAATGGSVTLPGGAAVQIPANALAADTTITIQELSAPPPGGVGAAYDLGPSGTTFSQPVTVSIPVPSGTTNPTIWTRADGAAQFTSLPTTVSGGVASAPASHFSVFVLGPVDLNGTWAGPVTYAVTNANGTPAGTVTQMQSRDIAQDVGQVTINVGNSSGFTAACTGTVQGDVLNATCTGYTVDGSCSTQYTQGGTVSATTWVNASSLTWSAPCGGQTYTAQSSPLAKQAGPPRNVAGSYARVSDYTMFGPGKTPYSGSNTGTATRTQLAGSSLVHNDVLMANGTTHTCKGVIVSDVLYAGCYGYNAARTIRYNSVAQGTISAGPPIDVEAISTTQIVGDPSGYTSMTSQIHDVMQ